MKDDKVINETVQNYLAYIKIRQNFDNSKTAEQFQLNSGTTFEIQEHLQNIADKKAKATDKIPPKLVKISAEVLSQPLVDAINNSISNGFFPDNAKIESAIKNHLTSVLNNIFSPYLAANRESCCTQHVLIKLPDEWRENLDNNYTMMGGC